MSRPGNRSTPKAGIKPESAALEADVFTTRPTRRSKVLASDKNRSVSYYGEERVHIEVKNASRDLLRVWGFPDHTLSDLKI